MALPLTKQVCSRIEDSDFTTEDEPNPAPVDITSMLPPSEPSTLNGNRRGIAFESMYNDDLFNLVINDGEDQRTAMDSPPASSVTTPRFDPDASTSFDLSSEAGITTSKSYTHESPLDRVPFLKSELRDSLSGPANEQDSPLPAMVQIKPPRSPSVVRPHPTRQRSSVRFRDADIFGIARAPSKVPFTQLSAEGRQLFQRKSMAVHARRDQFSRGFSFAPESFVDVETGDVVRLSPLTQLDSKRYRRVNSVDGALASSSTSKSLERSTSLSKLTGVAVDQMGTTTGVTGNKEVVYLGYTWRRVLQGLVRLTADGVNALRLTRGLQQSLPFLAGYEAFLLDQVIATFQYSCTIDKGPAAPAPRRGSAEPMATGAAAATAGEGAAAAGHDSYWDGVDSDRSNQVGTDSLVKLGRALARAFRNRNVSRVLVQQMARFDFLWHQSAQFRWNRWFDAFGTIPIIGITGFAATENFPNTRNHAIASVFRRVLGEGFWWTRVLTGRQALVTDDEHALAQNLAAESNGFETANRNQYGTYIGRERTNAFRMQHRLPTDESIVRTFITQPLSTLLNNGVEHTVRQLARHWHNMLQQPFGNFAHQRMEQLNPFELLRFHMPVLLLVLTTLRGLNRWDAQVLAPFVSRLQQIQPVESVQPVRDLVREMREHIVVPACGGVASRVDIMWSLLEAVDQALEGIAQEAQAVHEIVDSVRTGLQIGSLLIAHTPWTVPSDAVLRAAILAVCTDKKPVQGVCPIAVKRALNLLAPKDKRTLIELCQKGMRSCKSARLLLNRTAVLLQREIRRDALDKQLRIVSRGEEEAKLEKGSAYWLVEEGEDAADPNTGDVYIYFGKTANNFFRFEHRASGQERLVRADESIKTLEYHDAGEAITRAQKGFMTLELDHGKRFSYDAFMEFLHLRRPLRQMVVLAQLHCPWLDAVRSYLLQSIQRGTHTEVHISDMVPGATYYVYRHKQYEPYHCTKRFSPEDPEFADIKKRRIVAIPPQSMIVVGGGPTGLCTTLHCLENVLLSGGHMRLYESRDAFTKAGATFERSQIVRLDARWIGMLRYHLGTIYEDVFVPAAGETDPHYGNTLPSQGFIEITIKDLENMMHVQVAKLLSRGLLQHDTNSGAHYDSVHNHLVKKGRALKKNDLVLRKFDPNGKPCEQDYTWKVEKLIFAKHLHAADLKLGERYSVYVPRRKEVLPFRLVGVNLLEHTYVFQALDPSAEDLYCTGKSLPSIYPLGTAAHSACEAVTFECVLRSPAGWYAHEQLPFSEVENQDFVIDVGHCHVAEAIGKPHGSSVHFSVTTDEPYGVCCMAGLKVSMLMHNFGNRRWQLGIIDDVRSHTDQNTRVVGDFTKIVNAAKIGANMYEVLKNDVDWRLHFEKLVADQGYGGEGEDSLADIWQLLRDQVLEYRNMAPYRRSHLQTRFFETGDNFYLGMEFTREYDAWKERAVATLTAPISLSLSKSKHGRSSDKVKTMKAQRKLTGLKNALKHNIDRLWYEAALETIRMGDVYNPGGQSKVPRLHLVDSLTNTHLGALQVGEGFRLPAEPERLLEVLVKGKSSWLTGNIVVRDMEGLVSTMNFATVVRRAGNLTRSPDGCTESKVSIATFPVAHYVNHRCMRPSDSSKGYVFAFLGDEQSTPHFMRYSGLTGACINAMLFNNFIGDAIAGDRFLERFRRYCAETNWSNGEVVQRGTGANYGEDGFLRPGFTYAEWVRYMYAKVVEEREMGESSEKVSSGIISRDWATKFAAAMIPRGMEFNEDFLLALVGLLQEQIFQYFLLQVEQDHALVEASAAAQDQPGQSIGDMLRMDSKDDDDDDKAVEGQSAHGQAAAQKEQKEEQKEEQPEMQMEVKDAGTDKAEALKAALQKAAKALDAGGLLEGNSDYWTSILEQLALPAQAQQLLDPHVAAVRRLDQVVVRIVDHARDLHERNDRISSQLYNQPKSVDTVIDDFAVEAQNFAQTLTLSATLAAAALALQFFTTLGAAVFSAVGAFIAIGTITNASRYKNRNEEARVHFADRRLLGVMRAVYSCMGRSYRESLPALKNPFFLQLEAQMERFVKEVQYYGYPRPKEFLAAYEDLTESLHDPEAIDAFLVKLSTEILPDTYQVNSYLQQALVDIYATVEEMRQVEVSANGTAEPAGAAQRAAVAAAAAAADAMTAEATADSAPAMPMPTVVPMPMGSTAMTSTAAISVAARGLLERLLLFRARLEASLQRGPIKHGYFKQRALKHTHLSTLLLYTWTTLWRPSTSPRASSWFSLPRTVQESIDAARAGWSIKPVAVETVELRAQMHMLAAGLDAPALRREVMDLDSLYYATTESYDVSFIILTGWISLATGITFAAANLGLLADPTAPWALGLARAGSWSFGLVSPLSAILSVYLLSRKLLHLFSCDRALGKKVALCAGGEEVGEKSSMGLRRIRRVARAQEAAAMGRATASALAVVALPWALAAREGAYPSINHPLLVAAASLGLQVLTVTFLFIIEYSILYNLEPKLGEFVCEAFEEELYEMKADLTLPTGAIEPEQVQQRRSWEYVARAFLHRYRFDTVFAADRFGAIFQYVQGGLQRRSDQRGLQPHLEQQSPHEQLPSLSSPSSPSSALMQQLPFRESVDPQV